MLMTRSFNTRTLHAPDIDDDLLSLQTSITAAENWASSWHGRFGHSKTALLPIGQLAETSVPASTPEVEGQPIILVKQHKHLGVVFSNQLDWSAQMMHLLSMGKRKAGFLRFMARELPGDLICRLYVSCVRPALEYASPVWHVGISRQQAIALERIQASVARRVLKAPWRTPKQVLLERLQWPSLFRRRCVSTTCLLHTLMHNRTSPLNQCLSPFSQSLSSYNLRKPRQLILPRLRTSRHLHSFFYNSAPLWNSLPHSLQSIMLSSAKPYLITGKNTNTNFFSNCNTHPPPPALTNVRFSSVPYYWRPQRSGTPTLLRNPQILILIIIIIIIIIIVIIIILKTSSFHSSAAGTWSFGTLVHNNVSFVQLKPTKKYLQCLCMLVPLAFATAKSALHLVESPAHPKMLAAVADG